MMRITTYGWSFMSFLSFFFFQHWQSPRVSTWVVLSRTNLIFACVCIVTLNFFAELCNLEKKIYDGDDDECKYLSISGAYLWPRQWAWIVNVLRRGCILGSIVLIHAAVYVWIALISTVKLQLIAVWQVLDIITQHPPNHHILINWLTLVNFALGIWQLSTYLWYQTITETRTWNAHHTS